MTAETMRGVVSGEEFRQQLYTMVTRGRTANHIYVSWLATGIRTPSSGPTRYCPPTATELLEQILAPDGSPRSASTLLRDQQDPVVRLGESVGRYLDALYVGAEDVNGKSAIQAVEASANRLLPGLSEEPAWPSCAALCCLGCGGGRRSGRGTAHRRNAMGSDQRL